MEQIYFKGALIDEVHKEKRGLFFIKELFEGEFDKKAPISLRNKIDAQGIENLELHLTCFYRISPNSKITFENYKHMRSTLKGAEINIKQFLI